MGRAKGTRNNRAGEPAPGRGVWPSALDELQEIGGMSSAWHRRNHLVQDTLGEVDLPDNWSSIFPALTKEKVLSLGNETWKHSRIEAVISGIESVPDAESISLEDIEDDPLVEALWKQEALRLSAFLDQIEVDADIDWNVLEEQWKDNFVTDLHSALQNDHESCYSLLSGILLEGMQLHRNPRLSLEIGSHIEEKLLDFSEADPEGFGEWVRSELLVAINHSSLLSNFRALEDDDNPLFKRVVAASLPALADPDPVREFVGAVQDELNLDDQDLSLFRKEYLQYLASHNHYQDVQADLSYERAAAETITMYFSKLAFRKQDFEAEMLKICGTDEWQKLKERYQKKYPRDTYTHMVQRIARDIGYEIVDGMDEFADGEVSLRQLILRTYSVEI